jgi:hypothetical protein
MVVLFQGISWMHILPHLILFYILLILFIIIFGLSFYKNLGTYWD